MKKKEEEKERREKREEMIGLDWRVECRSRLRYRITCSWI
jgi:hypothetical protein